MSGKWCNLVFFKDDTLLSSFPISLPQSMMLSALSGWVDEYSDRLTDYTEFDKSGKIFTGAEMVACMKDMSISEDNYQDLKVSKLHCTYKCFLLKLLVVLSFVNSFIYIGLIMVLVLYSVFYICIIVCRKAIYRIAFIAGQLRCTYRRCQRPRGRTPSSYFRYSHAAEECLLNVSLPFSEQLQIL